MSQSPRDFFTTVETRLVNAGLSAAGISQNIQNIISNDQVTRRQVNSIQEKLNAAQKSWSSAFTSISNHSDPGYERSAALDLINDKIRNLNTVQEALNNLHRHV